MPPYLTVDKQSKRSSLSSSKTGVRGEVDWGFMLRKNAQTLSVVISANNEEETIGGLLEKVKLLKPKEIIVVENGSTDRTAEICLSHDVRFFRYPFRIGHDVGRAVGAKKATGDLLLFLDADIVFEPEELLPFVIACHGATDIALNNVNPFYTHSAMIDYVSMAKSFLNRMLLRSHLGYSSLTAIPHAMKRTAVEQIGVENLLVPPKAQAIAILMGLVVDHVKGVNVFRKNKKRSYNTSEGNLVENMILGDHIEAIHWVQSVMGERGPLSDSIRLRHILHANMEETTAPDPAKDTRFSKKGDV